MSKYAADSTGIQLEGIVSGLRERAETVGKGPATRVEQVVTFTLVCADEQPDVVVRATHLEGPLFEGDRVAIGVSARRLPGTPVRTVVLRNLTRGAVFGVTTGRRRSPRMVMFAVAAVALALTAAVLIAVLILG